MRSFVSLVWLVILCFSGFLSADERHIYLLRHFEKQSGVNNPSLTQEGQQRANNLVRLLADVGITEIYSSDYARTRETVLPLAESLGLQIQLYDPGKLTEFVSQLKTASTVLVVGHSNTTPALVRLLGGKAQDMDESDYGKLFVLTVDREKVGTKLLQVPPL